MTLLDAETIQTLAACELFLGWSAKLQTVVQVCDSNLLRENAQKWQSQQSVDAGHICGPPPLHIFTTFIQNAAPVKHPCSSSFKSQCFYLPITKRLQKLWTPRICRWERDAKAQKKTPHVLRSTSTRWVFKFDTAHSHSIGLSTNYPLFGTGISQHVEVPFFVPIMSLYFPILVEHLIFWKNAGFPLWIFNAQVDGISVFKDFGERNDVYVRGILTCQPVGKQASVALLRTDVHKYAHKTHGHGNVGSVRIEYWINSEWRITEDKELGYERRYMPEMKGFTKTWWIYIYWIYCNIGRV